MKLVERQFSGRTHSQVYVNVRYVALSSEGVLLTGQALKLAMMERLQ